MSRRGRAVGHCFQCHTTFGCKTVLAQHIKNHSVLECDYCERVFIPRDFKGVDGATEALENHIENNHTPSCFDCGQAFNPKEYLGEDGARDALRQHIERDHSFKDQSHFQREHGANHVLDIENDPTVFSCYCNKTFNSKDYVNGKAGARAALVNHRRSHRKALFASPMSVKTVQSSAQRAVPTRITRGSANFRSAGGETAASNTNRDSIVPISLSGIQNLQETCCADGIMMATPAERHQKNVTKSMANIMRQLKNSQR